MTNPVDVHVGLRIRQRRWMARMSQQQLGELVGVKFQQVQIYETGTNRVSASRLWEIATALDVPVAYFFQGLNGYTEHAAIGLGDVLTDKEAGELIRTYYSIPEDQRRRLFDLAPLPEAPQI